MAQAEQAEQAAGGNTPMGGRSERPGSLPPVRFALGPPGARPTVIARSDRYELWVASGGWGPGDGRREALSALTSLLGLS